AQAAGRFADAEPAFREAAAGYERFFGRGSEKTADAKLSLADVLSRRDRLGAAIEAFRGAVDDYRAQGNLERTAYTGAVGGLSLMLMRAGNFRGAEQAAREAYEVGLRIPNSTPRDRLYSGYRWAHALAFTPAARQCLALLEPELPADPQSMTVERTRGLRLLWRGDCYRELGDQAHAGASYDRAIALYESLHQPQSIALNMAYEGKALLLARAGRFADATPLLRRAIAGYLANQYLPEGPAVAGARIELAESLAQQGESTEARALLAQSGDIVLRELMPAHPARLALERLRARIKKPRSS
ncbi:MAG TPA: tetratricopeptide repeat protein, partial [Steroidobacteraceae bacterium]|nr:tetratricopeptide repeat protein [Steroidobacteraceae bacterium]